MSSSQFSGSHSSYKAVSIKSLELLISSKQFCLLHFAAKNLKNVDNICFEKYNL